MGAEEIPPKITAGNYVFHLWVPFSGCEPAKWFDIMNALFIIGKEIYQGED